MRIYWGMGVLFCMWMGMSWASANIFNLQGRDMWLLRSFLMTIGITGTAIIYAIYYKGQEKFQGMRKGGGAAGGAGGAAGAGAGGGPGDEVDLLVRDAEARLAASRLAQDAKLPSLPAVFLIGEQGTTKTSTMLHSGLEPELLAGQIYQESTAVASTRAANLWFARQTIFVEAGGKLIAEPARWIRLIKKLQPGKLKTMMGGKGQAPRAAMVCFDAEVFTRPGATEATNVIARNLQARLGEISQTFGISFPVYVMFTRMDRIPFFADYVRNLTNDESTQVVGTTLPIRPPQSTGVYAEEETRRLTLAFNELFSSLCDKRIDFLPRENDAEKLPGCYEFPREFRKLRTPVVQFLVDVCRPSQLRASPFLRGFYFSGVRPVVINEMASMPGAIRPLDRPAFDAGGGATRIFKVGGQPEASAYAPAPSAGGGTRKVPQWLFLTHLFNDIILQDRAAMGASASSTRTSKMRRGLLIAGAVLSFIWLIGSTVSYFGNRSLESTAIAASQQSPLPDTLGLPTRETLERLETLRQVLDQLTIYERHGAPWSLRWFLYAGSDMYPHVRQSYYNAFRKAMFASAQGNLLAWCKGLPRTPRPEDDYQFTYDTLKAYLITTYEYKRSTRDFLSPVMMTRWLGPRQLDPERARLAKLQWDFYSDDLKYSNPYDTNSDGQAIDRARFFLSQFGAFEAIYNFMVAEANKRNPSVNFNAKFPGSAEVVVNNRDVAGAFTKAGWAWMMQAFKKADQYFGGEKWVLGDYPSAAIDPAKLEAELVARYTSDYIKRWREYIRISYVVRYGSLRDAANKLNKTSSNQSPLLALFWLCSNNTNVDSVKVKEAFDAVHKVVPPTEVPQFIGPTNNGYMNALVTLQTSIDQAANQQPVPDPATAALTQTNASNAKVSVRQVAAAFRIDQEANVHGMTQKLMEDPITHAEGLLRGILPAELNAKAKGFCAEFNLLGNKYPFNSEAQPPNEATLIEVDAIFKPKEGKLWVFYESSLKNLLQKQGSQWVPVPGGQVTLTPQFVTFFNNAASFGDALYREGTGPKIAYALTALPSEGVKARTVRIDGQVIQAGEQGGVTKPFTWPGSGVQEAKLAVGLGGPEFESYSFGGLWAAFRLFGEAERWQPTGAGYNMEWQLRTGTSVMKLPSGAPLVVRFFVDLKGAPAFFKKGFFAQMRCAPNAAR